jgi:hypothetical protein
MKTQKGATGIALPLPRLTGYRNRYKRAHENWILLAHYSTAKVTSQGQFTLKNSTICNTTNSVQYRMFISITLLDFCDWRPKSPEVLMPCQLIKYGDIIEVTTAAGHFCQLAHLIKLWYVMMYIYYMTCMSVSQRITFPAPSLYVVCTNQTLMAMHWIKGNEPDFRLE